MATYFCPMDPEVVSDAPGDCPVCGMALEPRVAPGEPPESDRELPRMTRRLIVSAALSMPLAVVGMLALVPGALPSDGGAPFAIRLAELALASVVVLWGASPFFARCWRSLVSR